VAPNFTCGGYAGWGVAAHAANAPPNRKQNNSAMCFSEAGFNVLS